MQNVAKFRLIEGLLVPQPVRTNSAKYVHIFSISAQYVQMSIKEPLINKSCPKWFFGSI